MSNRLHYLLLPLVAACGGTPTINLGNNFDASPQDAGASTNDSSTAGNDGSLLGDGGVGDGGGSNDGGFFSDAGGFLGDGSVFGDGGSSSDGSVITDGGTSNDGSVFGDGGGADATIFGDDLDVVWVSIENPIVANGAATNLMVEARNIGANGTASTVLIRMCSGPCNGSPSALELGRVATGRLGPADTVILTIPITIPGFFGRGVYHLEAMIDPDQTIAEVSETNNVDSTHVTVGVPALDFSPNVSDLGPAATGTGNLGTITFTNPANGAITASWSFEGSAAFGITSSPPTPFTVAPGGIVTFDVGFAPVSPGPHRGAIVLTVEPDTAPSIAVPLWGYGL
jgi:hypothetical protein